MLPDMVTFRSILKSCGSIRSLDKGKKYINVGIFVHVDGQKARVFLEQMQREGVLPDVVMFFSTLKACGSSRHLDKGQKIHGKICCNIFVLLESMWKSRKH